MENADGNADPPYPCEEGECLVPLAALRWTLGRLRCILFTSPLSDLSPKISSER